MRDKKSQVEDWVPLMFIIVFLVVLFFFVAFTNKSSSATLAEFSGNQIIAKDASQIVLDYLRYSPENKNAASILSEYFLTKDPQKLHDLKRLTNEFFSKSSLETDYSTWSLEFHYGEETIIIETDRANEQVLRKEISRTYIPSYGKDAIELRLFIVTTRFVSA